MTRNIYSFMNHDVCLQHTERATKICLQFWMNSALEHLEKRQVSLPNRFCKHFGLHNDERIQGYLIKLSNNTNSYPGFSYETVMNSQRYTIHSWITQPRQFSLENIPTMSSIIDMHGEGWDTRMISRYFNKRNNIVNKQEEVPLTTSKQF
jgi:hypothetical protein